MKDLEGWAAHWLNYLLADGGPHGPGSIRTIIINNDSWSTLFSEKSIDESLKELFEPAIATYQPKSGRHAVTYERPWQGNDALWMTAVKYRDGLPHQHTVLLLPFKKRFMGRVKILGQPVLQSSAEELG